MRVSEYLPGFFEGFDKQVVDVNTYEELAALSFIKSWLDDPTFNCLRVEGRYLSAIMKNGSHYVIAILSGETDITYPPETQHG